MVNNHICGVMCTGARLDDLWDHIFKLTQHELFKGEGGKETFCKKKKKHFGQHQNFFFLNSVIYGPVC